MKTRRQNIEDMKTRRQENETNVLQARTVSSRTNVLYSRILVFPYSCIPVFLYSCIPEIQYSCILVFLFIIFLIIFL